MRPRAEQPIPTLIRRELESGPSTVHDLASVLQINIRNIREYMRLLHGTHVRICGWEQRTGPALPVWALGSGKDARRPQRKYKRKEHQNDTSTTQKRHSSPADPVPGELGVSML